MSRCSEPQGSSVRAGADGRRLLRHRGGGSPTSGRVCGWSGGWSQALVLAALLAAACALFITQGRERHLIAMYITIPLVAILVPAVACSGSSTGRSSEEVA